MADITCNVVKDLLPLYVDDVLSDDSRKVVDEHILACAECTDYYQKMKNPVAADDSAKHSDDKETLKKIRNKSPIQTIIDFPKRRSESFSNT